jgi:hypothetical protein
MPSSKILRFPRSENGGIAVRPAAAELHAPAAGARWWWLAVVGLALLAGVGAATQFGPWLGPEEGVGGFEVADATQAQLLHQAVLQSLVGPFDTALGCGV